MNGESNGVWKRADMWSGSSECARARAGGGGGGGAVEKCHSGIIMFWGYMLRFRMTRVEHLCGKRARG